MAILDENEFIEVEGRNYLNPQIALDESNAFIDNLRSTQEANNQQIKTDTYNLGTEIPSNLGGLTGAESYFTSRYQTPQAVSATANLRAAAQAKALNDVLVNEQAIWKNRYQQAYRNYQRNQYAKVYGGTGEGQSVPSGEIEYEDTGLTGLTAEPNTTEYYTNTEVITVPQPFSRENRDQTPEKHTIVTDKSGNILSVDGTYGREARARYRYLQLQGVVRGNK